MSLGKNFQGSCKTDHSLINLKNSLEKNLSGLFFFCFSYQRFKHSIPTRSDDYWQVNQASLFPINPFVKNFLKYDRKLTDALFIKKEGYLFPHTYEFSTIETKSIYIPLIHG